MKKISLILFVVILLYNNNIFSQVKNNISIGEEILIHSKVLNQDRPVYINLPEGYNDCVSTYPIMVVMDAENTFHTVSGIVGLMSWQGLIPNMITIGIPNIDRTNDFMPVIDTIPNSGNADRFIEFLNKELFPYIEENYRTEPFKTIYGHSYLGLFAIYCFKKYPETFNAYIASSPSLKWNIDYLVSGTFPVVENNKNRFLYFSIGDQENKNYIDNVNDFAIYLKSSANKNITWSTDITVNEDHDSNAILSILNGLKFIFPDWKKQKEVIFDGLPAIESHFIAMSEKYSYKIKIPEMIFFIMGDYCLQNGMKELALEIFSKYSKTYPTSYTAYYYLGKAFILNSDIKNAKLNFKKALELNPKDLEVKESLKNL